MKTFQGGSTRALAAGRRPVDSHMWLVSGVDFGAAVDAIAHALQAGRVQVAAYPLTSDAGEVLLLEASPFGPRDLDELPEAIEVVNGILADLATGAKPKRGRGAPKQLPMFGNPRKPPAPVLAGISMQTDGPTESGRAYIVVPLAHHDPTTHRDAVVELMYSVQAMPDGRARIVSLTAKGESWMLPDAVLIELEGEARRLPGSSLELQLSAWAFRVLRALRDLPEPPRHNPARKPAPKRESRAALAAARKDFTTFHWGDRPDKTMKVRTADLTLVGPLVALGELAEVAYDASKDGEAARWVHAFGDGEAGKGTDRPILVVDRAGRLGIIGGSYDVQDVGIVG